MIGFVSQYGYFLCCISGTLSFVDHILLTMSNSELDSQTSFNANQDPIANQMQETCSTPMGKMKPIIYHHP